MCWAFPYIFRGALDVRATTINEDMKIAAAQALANLAREDVPDDVAAAYQGVRPRFGPQYIIPVPFDPRLISAIPVAVAKAAMDSGVAQKPILNMDAYAQELSARRDPIASTLQRLYERVRRHPRRVVFAEGEEEQVMRAAVSYVNQRLGTACLLGREEQMRETAKAGRHRSRPSGSRTRQRPRLAPGRCLYRLSLCEAAAQRLPAPRLPAADQHRPQPFRRLHGRAWRCRRHGDRHHPELLDRAAGHPPLR
jgi:hypothetical protein